MFIKISNHVWQGLCSMLSWTQQNHCLSTMVQFRGWRPLDPVWYSSSTTLFPFLRLGGKNLLLWGGGNGSKCDNPFFWKDYFSQYLLQVLRRKARRGDIHFRISANFMNMLFLYRFSLSSITFFELFEKFWCCWILFCILTIGRLSCFELSL